MPPKKAPAASASRNAATKSKAAPYNKNAKKSNTPGNKKQLTNTRTPTKATFNKYKNLNSNLTSELDSLLGDLNSQLQRKKTKRDVRMTTGLFCLPSCSTHESAWTVLADRLLFFLCRS